MKTATPLDMSQLPRMRGVINRLEVSVASLQNNTWPSDADHAIGEAQVHIKAACDILKTIVLNSDETKARSRRRQSGAMPQTQAEFLAMPLLQHPGISSRLHNTLWGFFKEASKTDRKSTRLNSSHSTLSRMPSSA